MMRCAHCPLTGDCLGAYHRRLCDLVSPGNLSDRPDHAVYLGMLEAGHVADAPSQAAVDARDRLELVRGCDYRGPSVACGCNAARVCFAGRGAVSLAHCLACVAS